MGPRVLAWMKNTQYVGGVACDGEWLVVVGCYSIGCYLLLLAFIGCCSSARLVSLSFPSPPSPPS